MGDPIVSLYNNICVQQDFNNSVGSVFAKGRHFYLTVKRLVKNLHDPIG